LNQANTGWHIFKREILQVLLIASNFTQNLKIIKERKMLSCIGLQPGNYQFTIKEKIINIDVHNGDRVLNDTILTRNSFIVERAKDHLYKNEINVEKNENAEHKIRINLKNSSRNTRVHMIGFQFLLENLDALTEEMQKMGNKNIWRE
jgi:hypothetical protein